MTMISNDSAVEIRHEAKRVRFPRLERGGFMWGLDGKQFLVVLLAVFSTVVMQALFGPGKALLWLLVLAGPVGAWGAISWRGRSLMDRTTVRAEHGARRMTGKTRWAKSEKPVPQGTLALPGQVGARITVHSTRWEHGAMLYDAENRNAIAVLRCEAIGWPLADDDDRDQRAEAFSDQCKSLIRKHVIERIALMARTIPEQETSATQWHEETAAKWGVVDEWGQEVMHDVLDGNHYVNGDGDPLGPESQVLPVHRDTLVVISMSTTKAARLIRANGGGLAGAAQVLASQVTSFKDELKRCGVTEVTWASPAEVADAVRVAMDPSATEILSQQATTGRNEDAFDHGGALFVDDTDPEVLVTNGGAHSTYWIGQWPQTDVKAGFLEPLICEGSYPHVVTTVLTAEPPGMGLTGIERRRAAMESKKDLNARLKRPTSILDEKSEEDLREREEELATGHVDVRVTGYVTVSGADVDEVRVNRDLMERDASRLDVQLLKRQQWASFCAAALPLGWGLR